MPAAYSKDPAVNRSLHHSLRDGVATSIMSGGGESYLSAYALHFNANTAEVALLASVPPLTGSVTQILSLLLGWRVRRRSIILAGAGLQALSWLPLILLPLLFPEWALGIMLLCLIAYHGAGSMAAPQWSSMMGDLVPERWRGRYFARRNRLASLTSFLALVVAGLCLESFAATQPLTGFIMVFAIAALARFVAVYHLARMQDPQPRPAAALRRRLRPPPPFVIRFSLFHALMQFSVAVAGPFFAVYMLRDLQFSYLEFMLNTAAAVVVQFLTLNAWGRLADAFGNRLVLVVSGCLIPVMPALWLFSTDFWYLLGAQVASGAVWAGYNLSAGNYLYDAIPAQERTTLLAFHNVLATVGIFVGALAGGYLGSVLPERIALGEHVVFATSGALCGVFLISTLLRLVVAAAFLPWLKEARNVRRLTLRTFALRLTRSPRLVRRLRPRSLKPSAVPAPLEAVQLP